MSTHQLIGDDAGGESQEHMVANKMTAAVMYQPGDVRVEQVDIPEYGDDELLVKVEACGVCGSDIPRMNTTGAYHYPLICGHEFSGTVVEIGKNVSGYQVGELISIPPMIPEFETEGPNAGKYELSDNYDYFGSRRDGAYAEYVNVPVTNALKVPKGMDPRAAAMLDPAAIALHAVWKTKLGEGDRVAVLGAGPIGLFAIQWALHAGAKEVAALDVSEEKAQMAKEAGAAFAATSADQIKEYGGDYGFDVVIDSAGVPPTIALTPNIAARHGEVVFIGIPHADVVLDEKTFSNLLRREITWVGSWNSFSNPFPGAEWTTSAEKIADGTIKWEFMITHELPLSEVPSTMKKLADRSIFSSKVLFIPHKE